MKKLILLTILLSACQKRQEPNYAEILVKGKVPDAKCTSGKLDDLFITKCTVNGSEVIAVQGPINPFQAWDLKRAEAPVPAPVNPPYISVDAGVK